MLTLMSLRANGHFVVVIVKRSSLEDLFIKNSEGEGNYLNRSFVD